MRHFEPLGAHLHGEVDEALDLVNVAAVDDGVQRQRQTELDHLGGEFEFLRLGVLQAADLLGILRVDALDRELHVVEPDVVERLSLDSAPPTPEVIRFE